jgi:hypothetical protein
MVHVMETKIVFESDKGGWFHVEAESVVASRT